MFKMFLSTLLILLSSMMFFFKHPLSMGLMILLQTFLMCLLSGMLIKTYWFSYILFLTFLGGLLVLFIYVSSIASNELFNFSMNIKLYLMFSLLFIFSLMILFKNNLVWMNLSMNLEMMSFLDNFLWFLNENKINLSKLYNSQTFFLTMMLIIYLFITLLAVVKITNIFYGPLRLSN